MSSEIWIHTHHLLSVLLKLTNRTVCLPRYMDVVSNGGVQPACHFLHKLFKMPEGTHETACANARHPVYIFDDFFPDDNPVTAFREAQIVDGSSTSIDDGDEEVIEPVPPVMKSDKSGPHHVKLPGEDPFGYDRNWVPEFLTPFHVSRRHFSLGPRLSGTYFHSHGPALNYVMKGTKRFYLFPPEEYSKLSTSRQGRSLFFSNAPRHPVDVALDMDKSLPKRGTRARKGSDSQAVQPLVCDQPEGSYLFFPSRTGHATINLGKTVTAGMAFEMDPPGLSKKNELVWKANTVSSGTVYEADYISVGEDGSVRTADAPVMTVPDPILAKAMEAADDAENTQAAPGLSPQAGPGQDPAEDGVITDQDAMDAHAAALSASLMESGPPPDLPQPPPIDEEYEKKYFSGEDHGQFVVHPEL